MPSRLSVTYEAKVVYSEMLVREWSLISLVGLPAWMGDIQSRHGFSYLPTGCIPDRRGRIPWKEPEFTRVITSSNLGGCGHLLGVSHVKLVVFHLGCFGCGEPSGLGLGNGGGR